jgi:spore coat polysaccharide biosynthesis protein SpsF (cytidylyltransferase family)
MKIIAITQARVGSTRLPAKVLKEINGETLLDLHIQRILHSKMITALKVATTIEEGAERIIAIADKYNVQCYKGSVNDVLARFYFTAKPENPDYVIRLTSDCPLIDSSIIDQLIDIITKDQTLDYISNVLNPTFPDGVDVEIFKFSALEKAFFEVTITSDREHVTPYIWRNSSVKGGSIFKSFSFENSTDYSGFRLTVDEQKDFEVIEHLVNTLGKEKSWIDYVNYLIDHKEIFELNSHYKRNEGYLKSLKKD